MEPDYSYGASTLPNIRQKYFSAVHRRPVKGFIADHKKSGMSTLRAPRCLLEKEEIEETIDLFPEACQDITVCATSSISRIRGCTFAYGRSNDAGTTSNRIIHQTENVLTAPYSRKSGLL